MKTTNEIIHNAWKQGIVVPAFNIPHLPIMGPIVRALRDTESFGLIAVARCEWEKFEAKSIKAIRDEYEQKKDERYTRLHLDHVPVIDEDNLNVDFLAIIKEAVAIGYQSVMVDGSRLPLDENIAATKAVVDIAHAAGIPVEAELGAVLGHESGPLPPYEELFASGKGFTDPDEAATFVQESEVDWLSVAVGNIHGAISEAAKNSQKPEARINVEHLQKINQTTKTPLVLHGGSGIKKESILAGIKNGIAKINIGTTVRQVYENNVSDSIEKAQQCVYETVVDLINNELEINGSAKILN